MHAKTIRIHYEQDLMNSFRKHDRYLASTQNPDPRTYLLNLDFFAESENQKSSFMLQTQQY